MDSRSFANDVYTGEHSTNWVNTTAAITSHPSVKHDVRIVAGVTCGLSMIGSLAIILSYIFIRSVRSKARELLVHLSIMDLTFTSANLIGLVLQSHMIVTCMINLLGMCTRFMIMCVRHKHSLQYMVL